MNKRRNSENHKNRESFMAEKATELLAANKQLMAEIAERKRTEVWLKEALENLQCSIEEQLVTEEELQGRYEDLLSSQDSAENERRKYKDLFEFAPDGYVVTDTSGIIVDANRSAWQLLNTQKRFLVGRPFLRFMVEGERNIFLSHLSRVFRLKTKKNFTLRLRARGKKGIFHASVSVGVIRNAKGNPEGIRWLIRDITEQQQAEEKLRRSEKRYRELYESTRDGFVTTDLTGRIAEFNSIFREMLGYEEAELLDKTIFDISPKKWHEVEKQKIKEHHQVNGCCEIFEKEYRRKDGSVFPVEIRGDLLRDENGSPCGMWAFVRDITGRKRAERELKDSEAKYRHLSEQLEETVKQKVEELQQAKHLAAVGRMVAVIAHEVRNPLQTIRFGLESLRKTAGPKSEYEDILKEITYGVTLLNTITSELIEYARPLNLKKSKIQLRKLIDQALAAAAPKLSKVNVSLKLQQEGKPIFCDVEKLTQALVNLLLNAADAMPDGGKITIRSRTLAEPSKGSRSISVIDTGCGMKERDLEQIYEPFFTTKIRGIGLGLPMCKKIVEAHGGTITIQSKEKEGTTVKIILPSAPSR
jgi:two-component system cell cycle sensor histidine kinase/response regulator CckA